MKRNIKKLSWFLIVAGLLSCHADSKETHLESLTKNTVPERLESKYIIAEMKFETNVPVYSVNGTPYPYVSKWIATGRTQKDSINVAEGKYSLQLLYDCDIYYYLDGARIEGDSLVYSGKFKYSGAKDGKLYFYILQKGRDESVEHPPVPDSLILKNLSGKADWDDFTIKAKLKPAIYEIRFGLKTEQINNVWIDGWDIQVDDLPVYRFVKVKYPAEDDVEFDNGSGINIKESTPEVCGNLDVLGRVWGFLKYYHPAIIDGDINWDYELFRILPEVVKAKNKNDLNLTLYNWIEKLGDFPVTTYDISPKDSMFYSCFIDLNWINNEDMFTNDMIKALNKVKNAVRKEKVNYYLIPFRGGPRHRNFRAEKSYNNIKWEDKGFRLLALFRFWNVVEYASPYKYLTDKQWTNVLTEYIPDVLFAESEAEYNATMIKAVAEINDSHGALLFNKTLAGTDAERLRYMRYPVALTETDDGEFCVESSYTSELKPGDVIVSVDNKKVKEIYDKLAPYITASNKASQSRNIRPLLLARQQNDNNPLPVEIRRGEQTMSLELNQFNRKEMTGVKSMTEYAKANSDILFLNVGMSSSDELVSAVKKNMSAKGIIFDLRQYPRDFMSFFKLSDILLPDTVINLWFSSSLLDYPGNYKKYNECPLGKKNPDYFKGKVAILVNENTQSLGEMTAIALSYAPQAAVVGSTTSGADGNATTFVMPGNMVVSYTVFGAYYPDWVQCQRTGVKIDIHARPAVRDILDGKDVLIERAIEYIRK